jgi:hypothetical protein
MPLAPHDWSVVVAGFWNRAILTPTGIKRRLFALQDEALLELGLPIDGIGPYRVGYQGITVSVAIDRLIVEPDPLTFPQLQTAIDIARAAVVDLPQTPLLATGINVRYRTVEPPPPALLDLLESEWENSLSDMDLVIERRSIGRSVVWNGGSINIAVLQAEGHFQVDFNIEKRSNVHADHVAWLNHDADAISAFTRRLLLESMHLAEEDLPNAG